MTRDVLIVGPQFPLSAAWQLMQRHSIRHLPVVSGGHLTGMLSDRDVLLRATIDQNGILIVPRDPVSMAMTTAPITCAPDARVSQVARIMTQRHIDSVPIVAAERRLVGLVTSTDLMLLLIDDMEAAVLPFEFRLHQGDQQVAHA